MKKPKRLILTILIIVTVVGSGLALDFYQRNKVALPSNVLTLTDFAARMPPPEKVIAFERNGASYFELIGRRRPSFPTVPSGPPAYIFDSKGRISYWTIDIGDSPPYWENWQDRSNSKQISLREALKLSESSMRARPNKSLDRSGASVFRIKPGAAKVALIRAARSTQTLDVFLLSQPNGLQCTGNQNVDLSS